MCYCRKRFLRQSNFTRHKPLHLRVLFSDALIGIRDLLENKKENCLVTQPTACVTHANEIKL